MTKLAHDPRRAAATLRAEMRSVGFRVWLGLVGVLTFGLWAIPLFGVVGYELALATAPFGALCGLHRGHALIRTAQRARAHPPSSVSIVAPGDRSGPGGIIALALMLPASLMTIPLIGAAVHGIWAQTCDWWFGLKAYFWLTIASTALGAGTGAAVGLWLGHRRRVGSVVLWLIPIALLVEGVWRFYSGPAVFSYSPLVGFFPGNLYDEDIVLAPALYWARLEQLAVVGTFIAGSMAWLDGSTLMIHRPLRQFRRGFAAISGLAAAVAVALVAGSGSLGYRIGTDDVRAALGGVHRTRHFTIYYANEPAIGAAIELYGDDHELRLAQVCAALAMSCDQLHIDSYVFASDQSKGELMGARRVEMAKPWRREIYLSYEAFPHPSLRHEIAHVVAGEFGSWGFRVSARTIAGLPLLFNPGMIEGLAVAADWPGRSKATTPHQAMKAMDALGFAPDVDAVLSVRFLTLASSRGYTAAGSFLRFILERYGASAVRAAYASGGELAAATGRDRAQLVAEWRQMLAGIEVPTAVLEAVRETYRRPGVFARPCPHAIAARLRLAETLVGAGERESAIQVLRAVCRDAPREPNYRLQLADLLDDGAPAQRAEAGEIYRSIADSELGAVLTSEALTGLIELAASDPAEVARLIGAAVALPLDDERRRPFEAIQIALAAPGFGGLALRGYFFGSGGRAGLDRAAWAALAAITGDRQVRGLGWYLLGLQLDSVEDPGGATTALSIALELGVPSPRFVRAGARRLVVAAWRTRRLAQVEQGVRILERSSYEVDRWLAADWRERIAFTSR